MMKGLQLGSSSARQINAVVVSSGLMAKTVKVEIGVQQWNNHIRKSFSKTRHLLVHDPASSLRTGDIISISPGYRASKHCRHIVNAILAPFGDSIESRPPIPSMLERIEDMKEKKRVRTERREEVRRALEEATALGLGKEEEAKAVEVVEVVGKKGGQGSGKGGNTRTKETRSRRVSVAA